MEVSRVVERKALEWKFWFPLVHADTWNNFLFWQLHLQTNHPSPNLIFGESTNSPQAQSGSFPQISNPKNSSSPPALAPTEQHGAGKNPFVTDTLLITLHFLPSLLPSHFLQKAFPNKGQISQDSRVAGGWTCAVGFGGMLVKVWIREIGGGGGGAVVGDVVKQMKSL